MKIAVDSNVLISAVVFNSDICKNLMQYISSIHTFVFIEEIITETLNIIFNKFLFNNYTHSSNKKNSQNNLNKIYDVILTASSKIYLTHPMDDFEIKHSIRHAKDQKILNSLIESDIDIFVTGDKDFFEHQYPNLKIMSPSQFTAQFISQL
jgi:predicted nucleic acid-binding protein